MLLIAIGVIGTIILILGLVGCIVPALPGPPLSFIALLMLAIVKKFEPPLTGNLILIMAIITVAVTVLDYIIPVLGAKKYKSSNWGMWGAVAGMIIGVIYFPPFGMLIGAFLGAVVVELITGKKGKEAMKAGWGIFLGTMAGTIIKLIASGIMTYYFYVALF